PLEAPGLSWRTEEFLQIEIHHDLISLVDILLGFVDRRVAATSRSEPVTRFMKCRLVQRFEHHPYGFRYHADDHVRDSKTPLTAVTFGDPYPSNVSGLVGSRLK